MPYVQAPVNEFNLPRQSGELYGAGPSLDYLSDQFSEDDGQELTSFPAILVKMMIPNQELIMMMMMFLSSMTEAVTPNPKRYTILVN